MSSNGEVIQKVKQALDALRLYVEAGDFKGYDPYDTLLSPLPFHWLGKWGPVLATQFQKRNPINIRPLLRIPKEENPKAMGLFLHAYCKLYNISGREEYREMAARLFQWLDDHANRNYPGASWGYNFPWAGPGKYLPAFTPTAVATGFVVRGIHAWYEISRDPAAARAIHDATDFILSLPRFEDDSGIAFSYSPLAQDVCYNASLLAAEVLARDSAISGNSECNSLIERALSFVVSRQHPDGRWDYSEEPGSDKVRVQTDFHQGYVLESLYDIPRLLDVSGIVPDDVIRRGLEFYQKFQFSLDGRAFYRLPQEYPIDIHNQSQGIITFSRLGSPDTGSDDFAARITDFTLSRMRRADGAFIYRKFPLYSHRIPYIRWSQAWMMLALATLLEHNS